jgi:MFS family permease
MSQRTPTSKFKLLLLLLPLALVLMAPWPKLLAGEPNAVDDDDSAAPALEALEAAAEGDDDDSAHVAEEAPKIPWDETPAPAVATRFLETAAGGDFAAVWESGAVLLKETRTAAKLEADMRAEGVATAVKIEWSAGVPTAGGLRLDGSIETTEGLTLPVIAFVMDEGEGRWGVLDVQSSESFAARLFGAGEASSLDVLIGLFLLALVGAFGFIVWKYVSGLRGSPRELYLMFFTKVTEYSAYGAANLTFVLYLHNDVGLSDIGAGTYIGAWSMLLTLLTMVVGAVCDAIGVKRTLLIGCFALLLSRGVMPFVDNIFAISLLGFLPLAAGIAITGPVLSVGIKMFTTRAGATLGFGLFYTLMNVGWAIGAYIFDYVRGIMGDSGSTVLMGIEVSTYQLIILVGFFLTIPDLIAILLMRRGVVMTENGVKIDPPEESTEGSLVQRIVATTVSSTKETGAIFASVFQQRAFYLYLFMLGILVFVRLTFYHFHYTFPTYGIRVFGEGVKIGSMFGVLNPVIIVFLVPLIASLTTKVRSYWMLLIGATISAGSVFLATMDPMTFAFLSDTWFAELIYDRWLEIPVGRRDPLYMSLVVFMIIFTIGEAIWSPRLMQFTAEIAPPGREGSYVALSYLPYFGAKFVAGPMSGWLLATYVPEGAESYPQQYMVWVWIGLMAAVSPAGLLIFRRLYKKAEDDAAEAAAKDAAAALALAEEAG